MRGRKKIVLTPNIAKQICEGIEAAGTFFMAESKGLLPYDYDTVKKLMRENPKFDEAVKRAREEGIQNLLEKTISIAFDESRDVLTIGDGKFIPNNVAPIRDKLKIDTIHRRIGGARKIYGFAAAPTATMKFNILCQNFAAGNLSPEVTNTARSLCEFQFNQEDIKVVKSEIQELKHEKQ